MRVIALCCLLIASFSVSAQDLTGIWRGHFLSDNGSKLLDSMGIEDRYKFEIQLDQRDKVFEGVTYSYQTTRFYGKASAVGTVSRQTKKVLLQETKILEVKSLTGGACIMTCFLQYSKVGKEEFLEGKYTGINVSDSSFCGKGNVFLRKVPVSDFYEEPFLADKKPKQKPLPGTTPKKPLEKKSPPPPTAKLNRTPTRPPASVPAKPKPKPNSPPVPKPFVPEADNRLKNIPEDSLKSILGKADPSIPVPKVISTRQNEIVKTISTGARNVYVKIYDNGTIDNDTVSVYVDNRLIVSKERLTDKAITLQVHLDEKTSIHQLVMVAENLGEIPPNTSLMVVNAGEQIYEVRITSTEQKNAVVLFKYEP